MQRADQAGRPSCLHSHFLIDGAKHRSNRACAGPISISKGRILTVTRQKPGKGEWHIPPTPTPIAAFQSPRLDTQASNVPFRRTRSAKSGPTQEGGFVLHCWLLVDRAPQSHPAPDASLQLADGDPLLYGQELGFDTACCCFDAEPVLLTAARMKDKCRAEARDARAGVPANTRIHDAVRSFK